MPAEASDLKVLQVSEFENQVVFSDCLAYLKTLPSDSIDSFVSDVPYGLGSKEPTIEQVIAYLQGADLVTGDFMGKKWNIPSVLVWREVYRVLKPGAHVLCFGGTRTFDLISMGLRAAGFTNRDTIAGDHPALQWKTSQGMPKSTNISKAIDKKAGATRKVIGKSKTAIGPSMARDRPKFQSVENVNWQEANLITAPATPEAAEHEGEGTGLKPTWEPILVFRKPFKGTVTDNVLTHGTGALNIDGCRVKHASKADFEAHKAGVEAIKARGGSMDNSWKNSSDLSGANDVTTDGRWPPNFVIVHADGCVKAGAKRFKGSATSKTFHDAYEGESATGFIRGHSHPGNQHGDEDGLETSDNWQCVPGCPALALDEQSGERKSTLTGRADANVAHVNPGDNGGASWFGGGNSKVYADTGGASRFYPQFEGQQPVDVPFLYTGKATKRETTLDGLIENDHPTKKPLALMRWLVRLVTPKGGIVLDPYCGSGSTLHAAYEEGLRFVGVDNWEHAYRIAKRRMELVVEKVDDQRFQSEMFELMMGLENE